MLILALPHSANAATTTGYAHVHSDGHSVLRSATGLAATLSAHAGEVVAVVPHSRVSWLQVHVPPASHGNRLHSVLHGLLEDRLLDDPAQLHLATPPHAQQVARTGGELLVATCDKSWLRAVLAPLQEAGLTVQRIVPELSPSVTPALHVMGEPAHAHSVLCHPQGVTTLPPNVGQWHAFAALRPDAWLIQAEPAMVSRVQTTLQRQPTLQTAAQRWVQASQSDWDLAQGEWAQGPLQRLQRQLQTAWQTLRHAPAWRPVRWGLLSLLVLNVLGLNAMAWHARSTLHTQKAVLNEVLTSTFPSVTLVVDAPLQMQRELDVLLQKSGAAASTDFEPLLAALANVLPAGSAPTQLHFADRALRVHGVTFQTALPPEASARLQAQGLRLRQDGQDVWVLQAEGVK
jgi:general secretion pathway protein L